MGWWREGIGQQREDDSGINPYPWKWKWQSLSCVQLFVTHGPTYLYPKENQAKPPREEDTEGPQVMRLPELKDKPEESGLD